MVLNKVLEGKDDFGFNAATGAYEPMLAAGVIDPTKVTRLAISNALSAASMLLITEAVVADIPEKEDKAKNGMGHDHGDY